MKANIEVKGNKIVIFIILVVATLALLTGGLYVILKDVKDRNLYEKTTATITRLDKHYENNETEFVAYVSYEVDGVEYKDVRINWYSNLMYKGQTFTISYLKTNPYKIKSEKENLTVGIILLVMGGVCIAATASLAVVEIKKKM